MTERYIEQKQFRVGIFSARIRGRNPSVDCSMQPAHIPRGDMIHPTSIWARCTSFCCFNRRGKARDSCSYITQNTQLSLGVVRLAYSGENASCGCGNTRSALATKSHIPFYTISHCTKYSKYIRKAKGDKRVDMWITY